MPPRGRRGERPKLKKQNQPPKRTKSAKLKISCNERSRILTIYERDWPAKCSGLEAKNGQLLPQRFSQSSTI